LTSVLWFLDPNAHWMTDGLNFGLQYKTNWVWDDGRSLTAGGYQYNDLPPPSLLSPLTTCAIMKMSSSGVIQWTDDFCLLGLSLRSAFYGVCETYIIGKLLQFVSTATGLRWNSGWRARMQKEASSLLITYNMYLPFDVQPDKPKNDCKYCNNG